MFFFSTYSLRFELWDINVWVFSYESHTLLSSISSKFFKLLTLLSSCERSSVKLYHTPFSQFNLLVIDSCIDFASFDLKKPVSRHKLYDLQYQVFLIQSWCSQSFDSSQDHPQTERFRKTWDWDERCHPRL